MSRGFCIAVPVAAVCVGVFASEPTTQETPRGAASIVLDGDLSEWQTVPVAFRAAASVVAGTDEVRVTELRVMPDDRFVHALIEFNREVNLPAIAGTLRLAIDADGAARTGTTISDLPGTDLLIELSLERGIRARNVVTDEEFRSPASIGFAIAPTHSSRQFELRLDRRLMMPGTGVSETATTLNMKLELVVNGSRLGSPPINVRMPPLARPGQLRADEPVPVADPLAKPTGTAFRVLVWNVNGVPADRRASFTNIFRALDADVMFLAQVPPFETAALERWLPDTDAPARPMWRVISPRVAVRGEGFVAFTGLPFPPEAVETLATSYAIAEKVDREARRLALARAGIGNGAQLRLANRRLLAVSLQLYPGGHATSPRDQQRITEATVIRNAVQGSGGEAILIGGDLNLVGSRRPLDLLREGLDLDRSDLAVVDAQQLNGRANATWRNETQPFAPGRLDWLLYSDSSLELLHAFVFDSADLSPYWLNRHGLRATDSGSTQTSDHLPIVADFRWRSPK